mmetsp:Transcript_21555/g.25296  ORF Transcript_21555/g.25296 Transcript_21555/m.25296 type:complete len:168 (-) Transcript_21555:160-663(-)
MQSRIFSAICAKRSVPFACRMTQASMLMRSPMMLVQQAPVRQFAYHQNVIDHYENPRNVGSFDKKSQDVGTGLVGAPACGDVMKLQIKVDETSGTIEKAVFKTFGCGSAIASSSYATELLEGMPIEDAVKIKNSDIAQHLKLPPVKLHCSMLAEDAIQAAIKDYKTK